MSDLRTLIEQCREIEKAATPGPWTCDDWLVDAPGKPAHIIQFMNDAPQDSLDARACATARNLFAALLDVVEAAEWACDGSGCEFEDERVRYETWQHHVGAMRALREKLAKFGEAMEANRD